MRAPFKRAPAGPVLSRDERSRQGRAVKSALDALGQAGALAFLNRHHDALRGRPIDLAVRSDRGLEAVEAALGAGARAVEPTGESARG